VVVSIPEECLHMVHYEEYTQAI